MGNGFQKSHDEARQGQRDTGRKSCAKEVEPTTLKSGADWTSALWLRRTARNTAAILCSLTPTRKFRPSERRPSRTVIGIGRLPNVEIKQNPTDAETETAIKSLFDDLSNNVEAD